MEYQVGDHVLIVCPKTAEEKKVSSGLWYNPFMDQYDQQTAVIRCIDKDGDLRLDIDGEECAFYWAVEWVTPLPKQCPDNEDFDMSELLA